MVVSWVSWLSLLHLHVVSDPLGSPPALLGTLPIQIFGCARHGCSEQQTSGAINRVTGKPGRPPPLPRLPGMA